MTRADADEHVERLTALDASNLRVEEHGMPMHVAALALLDGATLLDSRGGLRLEAVRRLVQDRIRKVPRLRQVLARPGRGGGRAFWVDDDTFDIAHHVRTCRVPEPGDEAALLELCCRLNEPPMDRSRPLWEMWVLTGLEGGRVGLLIRLHHVVADGVAALAMFHSMMDETAGQPDAAGAGVAPPWRSPKPAARLAMLAGQVYSVARHGGAPRLSFNRPVGPHRRLALVRADLAAARAVAHRHGGKVNDVVLAAVAGGARRLLESRGELEPDLVVKVSVAASVRAPGESGGNRVGIRVVPVPVGDPDAARVLDMIVPVTAAQRRRPPYQPSGRLLQRWMVRVMPRQRMVNLGLSNLPGPPHPLFFAGAELQELFQIGVVQGNLSLAVGVLSYAGQLNVDVVADADAVPDVSVFAAGVADAFEQLGVLS